MRKQSSRRTKNPTRVSIRTPKKTVASSNGWALKEAAKRIEDQDVRRKEIDFSRTLMKGLTVTETGESATLEVPPVPLPLDKYENAPRPLDPKSCVALGLEFCREFLARTGNVTGKPTSPVGILLEFPSVITYICNLAFRAARGQIPKAMKMPNWMAFFLTAMQPKSGLKFLDKKISYNFSEIPPDHLETITGENLRNEVYNASLIDDEGSAADPLNTGGFRPMYIIPSAYDEEKAALMFAEMNTFLDSPMQSLDKPTTFMGIDPTKSGDAYCYQIPAALLGDYAGVFDLQLAQYRKAPEAPILGQALFVQRIESIDKDADSRQFTSMQACGGSSVAFWQAAFYAKTKKEALPKNLKKELLRPVPIFFNELLKYHVAMAARAIKALDIPLSDVPNALEQAVCIYNALMGFFWNTTRPFSGTALPRAIADGLGQHPVFLQCDATNAPSTSSRRVIMFYQLVQKLRSFFVLCADKAKTSDHTIRRVPALWQTYDFEPAEFIHSEFLKHGIALPAVPVDSLSGTLWGRWYSDKNRWAGGDMEPRLVNLTDSPYVDDAQIKFNKFMGLAEGATEIASAYPSDHDYTMNKFIRIYESSNIPKQIGFPFGGKHRMVDGTIYTNQLPDIVLGSDSSGPETDFVVHMGQTMIPSLPAGVFGSSRYAQYNMILELPEGINRENGGSKVDLRVQGFVALTVGNGVIPPTFTSELSASYFFAHVMHGSGGGFYKVGAKEDWSFMSSISGVGKTYVDALVSKLKKEGIRNRVILRVAKVASKKEAQDIILRHQKARATGAKIGPTILKWVDKVVGLVGTFLGAIV